MAIYGTPANRRDLISVGQGLITQNMDRGDASSNSIMISGTVYYMPVGLVAGDVITGVAACIATSGTSGAGNVTKVGLYSVSGTTATRVAVSADLTSSWSTAGLRTNALSATYTVTTSGMYYVAILAHSYSIMPTPFRGSASGTLASQVNSGARPYGVVASQTDLDTSETVTNSNAICYWVGVY